MSYYWDSDEEDHLIYDDDGYARVYIDGACFNNGKSNPAAGLGVVFNYYHSSNYSGPVKGRATNNKGEIQSATWAINEAIDLGIDQLRLVTDSKFLINSATNWMHGWKQNGWCRFNGQPLANKIDFIHLDRAMYNASHIDIDWEYVRAHSGDELNDMADYLAKNGARQYACQ